MPRLIIEEDMRLQNSQDAPLFYPTKKEGIVRHYTPTLKRLQRALM